MTASLAALRRAHSAWEAYERRVPVQLSLSAPAGASTPSPMGSAESLETRVTGAENHSGAMTELENVPGCNPGVLADRWRFESSSPHRGRP